MNRFAKVYAILTALLLVSISGAVIAATVEIETIVGTVPVLSLVGVGLCLAWIFHRRGLWAPLVALSLPAVSLSVFGLIYSRNWGPSEAAQPVSAILLVYQIAIMAVGLIGIREQLKLSHTSAKTRVQFSIRSLLGLTAIAAVALGAVRIALDQGAYASVSLAVGLAMLTFCGILAVAMWPLPPVEAEVAETELANEEGRLEEPLTK